MEGKKKKVSLLPRTLLEGNVMGCRRESFLSSRAETRQFFWRGSCTVTYTSPCAMRKTKRTCWFCPMNWVPLCVCVCKIRIENQEGQCRQKYSQQLITYIWPSVLTYNIHTVIGYIYKVQFLQGGRLKNIWHGIISEVEDSYPIVLLKWCIT